MLSLDAAQAAMRLDPTILPPDGSVCTYRGIREYSFSPEFVISFKRFSRFNGKPTVLFDVSWSGKNITGSLAMFPGDLVLVELPEDPPPIIEWLRWPSR